MGISVYAAAPIPNDEDRRGAAVGASGALDAAGDDELREIVGRARRHFGTSMAAISIIHEDWQYLIAAEGVPEGVYSRRTSFCGHVLRDPRRVLFIDDAATDPRFAGNPVVTGDDGIRSYAGAALLDDDGHALGSLCVFDWRPRASFDPIEARALQAFAATAVARLRQLKGRRAA